MNTHPDDSPPPPIGSSREFGLLRDLGSVGPEFFEALPEDVLRAWEDGDPEKTSPELPAARAEDATHAPGARARLGGPGVRAFFKITGRWGLDDAQRLSMLGHSVDLATLHAWQAGAPDTVSTDKLERLSFVAAIHEGLERIFWRAPEQSKHWLHQSRADAPFMGQSPVDYVLTGGITELAALRQYLDQSSGGPPSRQSYPAPPQNP